MPRPAWPCGAPWACTHSRAHAPVDPWVQQLRPLEVWSEVGWPGSQNCPHLGVEFRVVSLLQLQTVQKPLDSSLIGTPSHPRLPASMSSNNQEKQVGSKQQMKEAASDGIPAYKSDGAAPMTKSSGDGNPSRNITRKGGGGGGGRKDGASGAAVDDGTWASPAPWPLPRGGARVSVAASPESLPRTLCSSSPRGTPPPLRLDGSAPMRPERPELRVPE